LTWSASQNPETLLTIPITSPGGAETTFIRNIEVNPIQIANESRLHNYTTKQIEQLYPSEKTIQYFTTKQLAALTLNCKIIGKIQQEIYTRKLIN